MSINGDFSFVSTIFQLNFELFRQRGILLFSLR